MLIYKNVQSQNDLLVKGPYINEIVITLPDVVSQLRKTILSTLSIGLVDTGACITCIDKHVAEKLALIPVRQALMAGAMGGAKQTNIYSVNLIFKKGGLVLRNVEVYEVELKGYFNLLLGRDVLSNSIFTYNGITGEVHLEIPKLRSNNSKIKSK